MIFILAVLALWRITHLVAEEDGPWNIIYRIRKAAGTGFFGSLLDCFYCVSIWTAIPFGYWLGANWTEKFLYWWALSGAVCLLQQLSTSINSKQNKSFYEEDQE